MLDTLINLDSQLLLFFNSFHTPFLDRFMMLFTGRFIWAPMYALILLLFFKKYHPLRAGVFVIMLVAAIALSDQTCATVLRPIFERLRPSNLNNPLSEFVTVVDGYRGGRYGFPSCHAANSFALAVFLSLVVRRRVFSFVIFAWAILNSYSRMYLGVHYPGDILVGAAIGSAYGFICYRLARLLAARLIKRRDIDNSDQKLISRSLAMPETFSSLIPDMTITIRVRAVIIAAAMATTILIGFTALFDIFL